MAHISGHVSGTWDNHTEYTKNAVDTEHSAKVEAAKKGIVQCSKHPGTWTSKPKSGMMNKNQVEVRDCPKCQEEHELELKRKQLEMLPPPIANPIHAAPRAGQPVALGVMVANQGQGYVDRNKGYSSEWYNLCDDCPVCICTFCPCCIPLAIMDIAHRIHAPSHGIGGIITTIMATVCYPCGILCCAKQMAPCFITELIKKSMQAHGIGRAPGPCGDAEAFCGCWCQVLFCTPCTLGVIYREAKSKPVYK